MNKLFQICFLYCCLPTMLLASQGRNTHYLHYIRTYSSIAIDNQNRYKIPASITLAQGLLESGAGRGRLAKEGNNHFGIKCHDWRGKKIYHNDDRLGECFRRYKDPSESYRDHSLFLTGRERYDVLFKLRPDDYEGWAKGLQRCGYATDKQYANKLIRLIETYKLYQFDNTKTNILPHKGLPAWYKPQVVYRNNNLIYIIVRKGDTPDLLHMDLDFSWRKLRKYNELPKHYTLQPGDIIYLEKKNRKAATNQRFHQVKAGESMYQIAQWYGIRIQALYKMNRKNPDYIPTEGDIISLH